LRICHEVSGPEIKRMNVHSHLIIMKRRVNAHLAWVIHDRPAWPAAD
jgi:hypothetical protein